MPQHGGVFPAVRSTFGTAKLPHYVRVLQQYAPLESQAADVVKGVILSFAELY